MFDKICIKNKELDIAFLIDSLLFYNKVVVLVHRKEMALLINSFGENLLKELITSGRLDIKIKQNHLGSIILPNGMYNIDTFSSKNENIENLLYESHRLITSNSTKNLEFSNTFSKITDAYIYPQTVTENIIADFNNKNLLAKTLPIYFNSIIPEYKLPSNIEIEIDKKSGFGIYEGYTLHTNINMEELNRVFRANRPGIQYNIDYSGFLLSMAESKGDIEIASDLESELVTSDLYSKFIAIEIEEIITQRANSQQQLNLFNEYILKNCSSLGMAYVTGAINGMELIKILKKQINLGIGLKSYLKKKIY